MAFYWRRLRRGVKEQTALRCAACGQAAPLNATVCPHCQTPITVDSTMHAVLDPPRQRWLRFLIQATPETRRRIQWAYLLASGLALWWMLADLEKKQTNELFRDALLSVA
jgi:predicted amidophosphoribosyltransferase